MRFGLCLEMVFTKEPFEERLKNAAKLGFKYVEMWFTDMTYKGTPERLAKLAAQHGVTITNTVIGSPDGSIGGGLTDPGKREQWLARTRATLDFNLKAGIPATIVCTGNLVAGLSAAQMERSVLEGLQATVELAEKAGVTLLLEVLNTPYDHAGYWLTSSDQGAELCRRVGSERLKLLYDCYHMQIMEGDLLNHIKRNLDVIGHVHSAGVPGRHELYNGEVDYRFVTSQLGALGYRGVFGLEYSPSIDDELSLKNTLQYLAGR
jgi:hydroxypyruvate isomerase